MIDKTVMVGVGEVTYELQPTLDALRKINRRYDSLLDALRLIRSVDFDAVCFILAAGAGLSPKQTEMLEKQVFAEGVINVIGPLADFMTVLMDPLGKADDDDLEEKDLGNSLRSASS